jgi:uncharacterized protein (DUF58 family)
MIRKSVALLGLLLVSSSLLSLIGGGCVEAPRPAAQSPFRVENLSIEPSEVQPNEVVTITVSVTNTHDTWGIYSLVLKINGVKEAESQANVDAGGTEEVSFEVTRKDPGRYAVFINGLSGSFTVVAPSD